jgi:rsbT antagonist protein RsbS
MSIAGVHLTRIGRGNFLLEPLRSLNIAEQGQMMQDIVCLLQQEQGVRLYYDLSDVPVIDPVYYDWLDKLARICLTVNIKMVCIHMQPTAALTLSAFLSGKPLFETALSVS